MGDNVVSLKPVEPKADAGLTALLESLLARARSGELLSLVVVGEMRAGAPLIGHSLPDDFDYYRLQGGISEVSVLLREYHESTTAKKTTSY